MCANWVGDNRDMSPDRNRPNHYQLDNVGLQIELGLPIQLIGVSLMDDFMAANGSRGRGGNRRNQYRENRGGNVEVQKTCDGIPIRKLYIPNISIEVQYLEMKQIFGRYGPIRNIFIGLHKNDNNKQFAFITFVNPLHAARVLSQQRFQDIRGRIMYVMPADSWHQPRDLPDGTIDWLAGGRRPAAKEEDGSEEEEQVAEEIPSQVETEINEGSLNMLNDDCLLHIFSFLSYKEVTAVERVCKRWQALSFRMWRCLHELNFQKDGMFSKMPCTTKVLDQYLKRCGSSLTTLDLTRDVHTLNENTLAVVAKHCKNLEVLRVKNVHAGNRCLAHLGRSCLRLKELVMDGCSKVSDNDMNALLSKCPDLRLLDLSNIEELNGKCLTSVQGPVTHLRLSQFRQLNNVYFIKGLEKMSPTLESLVLNSIIMFKSEEMLRGIVDTVPNLTSISLTSCVFSSRALIPLGQLKKLTSLNLTFCGVCDATLSSIVEGCEELTSVNLSGSGGGFSGTLSERGLSMLSRLRKLTDLNISYLEATDDVALKNITARNCKLKSLLCRGCPDLTDEGTETVVTLCNELELYDLSGCYGVTSKTAETALTSVKMRTNNTPLLMIVGGTQINKPPNNLETAPLLTIDWQNFSEDHLRPDILDNLFFPPSDSDDDEDLDHLCERIALFGDWRAVYPLDIDEDIYDSYDSDVDEDDFMDLDDILNLQ